jgi:hypothetical protein
MISVRSCGKYVFLFSERNTQVTQSAKTKHDGLQSSFVRQSLVSQYTIFDLCFVCAHDSNQIVAHPLHYFELMSNNVKIGQSHMHENMDTNEFSTI